ncbi:DNA-binding response OmpR family regulator [Haloferula luteola]|uniref:DNA-binding response OmpR family regulator n=1 Tax=Haloferula luteola TaxID=595692 RepID=A0A840V0E6_9BACT|nr:response regulator transcription factor [Haloferula luteola]MBB5350536.1 DNA-binding response OmpR family regulator [Haloferula luteola]
MTAKILLIEDESAIAEVVGDLLRSEGHEVESSAHGEAGFRRARSEPFDLLILDLMLPGKSGFEICHEVRKEGFGGGILMLTARGVVHDRVRGLQSGADDYMVKPFDPDELVARVHALLRRLRKSYLGEGSSIQFGDTIADFTQSKVYRNGESIHLTTKESELLQLLVKNAGSTLSRESILSQVWADQPHITERTVDVHISWLRQKIETNTSHRQYIVTLRGKGYRFEWGCID